MGWTLRDVPDLTGRTIVVTGANSGIGYELWTARRYGKTPEVFAGILTIGIIGLVSDQLIRAAHRRAFRYLA